MRGAILDQGKPNRSGCDFKVFDYWGLGLFDFFVDILNVRRRSACIAREGWLIISNDCKIAKENAKDLKAAIPSPQIVIREISQTILTPQKLEG